MNILAISGSLRAVSTNVALLDALARAAPDGLTVSRYCGLEALPIFNPDREGEATPAAVLDWANAVAACDGLVVACPEYAHGIPGGLKNALDWLVSRFEIPGKPVMIAHSSHRGEHVLAALREVLTTMSVDLVEEAFVRIPLVGKTTAEMQAMLDAPETRIALRDSLERFRSATTRSGKPG